MPGQPQVLDHSCQEKAIWRSAWKACSFEMFESLHPNGKWKECQVCAKRKAVIAMCFPLQPSWAKEHDRPSRLQSCHLQTVSSLQLVLPGCLLPGILPKHHNTTAPFSASAISPFICPQLCCPIPACLLIF